MRLLVTLRDPAILVQMYQSRGEEDDKLKGQIRKMEHQWGKEMKDQELFTWYDNICKQQYQRGLIID